MTEFEKTRQRLEREVLPELFAQNKQGLMNAILDKEGRFFTDLLIVAFGMRDESYKADAFEVYLQRARSDDKFFNFLVVRQPEPTAEELADTIFFCFEETTDASAYFMIKKSPEGTRDICGISKGDLTQYGEAPFDPDKEFQKTANIFIRSVLGAG